MGGCTPATPTQDHTPTAGWQPQEAPAPVRRTKAPTGFWTNILPYFSAADASVLSGNLGCCCSSALNDKHLPCGAHTPPRTTWETLVGTWGSEAPKGPCCPSQAAGSLSIWRTLSCAAVGFCSGTGSVLLFQLCAVPAGDRHEGAREPHGYQGSSPEASEVPTVHQKPAIPGGGRASHGALLY